MSLQERETDTRSPAEAVREDGFYVLEDVYSEEQLAPLRELTGDIVAAHETGSRDPYARASCEYLDHRTDQGVLYDVFQRHPEFQPFATNDRVLDAVEELLGPTLQLYVNSVVYKPEESDNEVPYHQDFMALENESEKIITWMPMYDVDRENGCLKAIPGSHTEGTKSWHREDGETHHDRLDDDQYDESEEVYLEMDAGDVLLFHQNVVHGSDAITKSPNPRYAYRVVYKAPERTNADVPRTGPITVRGNDPESLREGGLELAERDLEESFPQVRHYLREIGKRLTQL